MDSTGLLWGPVVGSCEQGIVAAVFTKSGEYPKHLGYCQFFNNDGVLWTVILEVAVAVADSRSCIGIFLEKLRESTTIPERPFDSTGEIRTKRFPNKSLDLYRSTKSKSGGQTDVTDIVSTGVQGCVHTSRVESGSRDG